MASMLLKLLRRWIEGSTAVILLCGYALCVTLHVTLCVGIACHCVGSALQHDGHGYLLLLAATWVVKLTCNKIC